MPVPPESIQVDRCYLTRNDQVARVTKILPNGYVLYAFRSSAVAKAFGWTRAQTEIRSFVALVEREVPCDWTPSAS